MTQVVRPVAIVAGARIPFARSNTRYAECSNQALLTASIAGLVDRYQLHGETLGVAVAGAIVKHSRDFSLCRESILGAGLSPTTPAFDLQQACATGLEAAITVANQIALGHIEVGLAGGVDTGSDVPIGISEPLRKMLLRFRRARTLKQRLLVLAQLRPWHFKLLLPANVEPRTGLSMGQHCEQMAKLWQIARQAQDELALSSHQKAQAAFEAGFFKDLVVPFLGLNQDNNIRPNSSLSQLAALKPVFDTRSGLGTLTAGNSTPLTDGSSCVLLASEQWAKSRGLEPMAYLTHYETAAVDFVTGREGLLMAPAYAVPKMLSKAQLTLQDFDFYEIHEAFAAQVLCTLKSWQDDAFCKNKLGLSQPLGAIHLDRLNVHGSSLAIGHPFAATGGRILATAAQLLKNRGQGRALVSICAAGGLGVTAILER